MNLSSPFQMGSVQNQYAAPYDFSISELIKESWRRVSGAKATFWGAIIYFILISIPFSIINYFVNKTMGESSFLSFVVQFTAILVTFPLSIGLAYLGVRRSVDLPIRANLIFSMYHFFKQIIGLAILQYVMTFILMALIILTLFLPSNFLVHILQVILGFILYFIVASFVFSFLLVVEKQFGIWSAYKASFYAFKQHWFKITVAWIAIFLIYLVSLLPLFIGIIWTLPMLMNFSGILYRIAFGVEEARHKVG